MELIPARAARYARASARWARLLLAGGSRHRAPGVRVFYGHDRVPEPGEAVAGGSAKIQRLAARFPNHPGDFSIAYLGSNWTPRDLRPLLRYLRSRRIPLVVNQDGVGYPAWAGADAEEVNRPIRALLAAADHVLYNAVDVSRFTPAVRPPDGGPVLLLGGDQSQAYRLQLALETLAVLLRTLPGAELLVTGRLAAPVEPIVARLGLEGRVHALGRYVQTDAPGIFRRAHLLLHTKVNDPCPSVVIEALATGLPVVYPASGGVPELVGEDAGIGVPHPDGFERDEPPSAEALADAVSHVLVDLRGHGAAARARAVERFSLDPWLDRHAELFDDLSPR